ncbi:chitin deacetylase 7-like [Littorina saxatilis]|uniref:Chitin-binding type-2 domain-containing protein n=1 Tax=Littorina saxatilis TaxID=31220 RepID=A0AAN9G3T6_9CAEN
MFTRQKHLSFLLCYSIALLLTAVAVSVAAAEPLGITCSVNGAVHCHSADPASFTRCVNGELHVFQCPGRLQFSTHSQMCDWPLNADCHVQGETGQSKANPAMPDTDCQPSRCKPPSCWCPGTLPPGGLSVNSTPQMVMLTFDDEVTATYYQHFQRLFRAGRNNPNGCPVRGCLFVSDGGTDYGLVRSLYAMGMEVASHTLSHRHPFNWWATATYQHFVDEAEGMRRKLVSKARVPYDAVQGFRVPYLQVGGDSMYKALYYQNFTYDSSMFRKKEGGEQIWPFTLDFPLPHKFCQLKPCPSETYPGLWEIPLQKWYCDDGNSCPMPDGCCLSTDIEEDLKFFRSNFKRYYDFNRAPFGIFIHAGWFNEKLHLEALDHFIDELLMLEDVYFVTPIQVISWMKNPTPLDKINSFRPWACETSS